MLMSKARIRITRRQLLRMALVGTAAGLLETACQPGAIPTLVLPATAPAPQDRVSPTPQALATPASSPTSTPAPRAAGTFPPLPQQTPKVLANRNDPHYNVRYVNPFPPVDHAAWRLEVKGLVESPGSYSLDELLAWPQMEQISRMKCVECWSFKARWGGFQYAALAERAGPLPEATHVRFDCADKYWEVVSMEELADPRVVFVLRMNDELLLDEYGALLRMMFPAKYGYKSAKAVTAVTFVDEAGAGFWSTVGPYTVDGKIVPGSDYPQDLGGERQEITGGEITAY
jgi:DMSO/TMAO reductase YedYZ molybdopterin-dependent catalytic subunit